MADLLISDLDPATALALTDLLELEQGAPPGNVGAKATLAQLRAFLRSKRPVTAVTFNAGGTSTVDCSAGNDFTLAMGAGNTTLAVSNLNGAGFVTEFELVVTQDGVGGRTLTLPASFKPLGGSDTAIATAANAVTVLSAKTFDNGTTWVYAMQERGA